MPANRSGDFTYLRCGSCGQGRSMYTRERIEELGRGYDLDGGGYAFEEPEEELRELLPSGALVYDGDWEYFPGFVEDYGHSCPFFVFLPHCSSATFPSELPSEWRESRYYADRRGILYTTERDCSWCDGEGEETFEECPRCEGTGLVESAGGLWCLYVLRDIPELELLALALED